MKKSLYNFFSLLALLVFSQTLLAQGTQFYYEDFSGGIPEGWTTEDASGGDAIFTWCSNPETGQSDGCPAIWNTPNNMQTPFDALTADNGFMTMDSDAVGALSENHVSLLTSAPLDASDKEEVFLRFQTHIGYFDLNADTNAVVKISADGGANFDTYTLKPFQDLDRWSANPASALVNISATAAGQSSFIIQWSWTGNFEYHWSIDDVELFDGDPREANDMQVNDNFFAIPSSIVTPLKQIEPIYFLADIENAGREAQEGVNLNISITNNNSDEVYSEDLDYGTIGVDSIAQNVLFDGSYTPNTVGSYTGTYTVSSTEEDANPENNSLSFNFQVSDTTYAKETGFTRPVTSAPGNWNNPDTDPHNIAYGNYFYIKDGEEQFVRSVSFGIGNAQEEEMLGKGLVIVLYSWVDENSDGDAQPIERRPMGSTFYFIDGTEAPEDIITVSFPEEGDPPIPLVSGIHYLLMLEYFTDDQTDIAFAASEDYDYSAMVLATTEAGAPRYSSFLGIAADLADEDYGSVGFGRDIVPVVRMNVGTDPRLDIVDGVNEALAPDNKMAIYPNPTQNELNVMVDLTEKAGAATFQIMDITGKIIREMEVDNLLRDQLSFDIRSLSTGTYLLRLVTDAGTRTEKFMVK